MSRADTYLKGSFRGVPFIFVDASSAHGRRGQVNEYPGRDDPYFEDLGRKARQYQLSILVIGPDWRAKRDALLRAFETRGPGTLIHPTHGSLLVVCTDAQPEESTDKLGQSLIRVTFLEQGAVKQDRPKRDTGADLDGAATSVTVTSVESFTGTYHVGATWTITKATDKALGGNLDSLQGVVGFAKGQIGGATGWFSYVSDGIKTVRRAYNDIETVVGTVRREVRSIQRVVSFVSDLTSMRGGGLVGSFGGLGGQLSRLVRSTSTLFNTGSGEPFRCWSHQRRVGLSRTVLRPVGLGGSGGASVSSLDASKPLQPVTIGGYDRATLLRIFNQHLALAAAFARPPVAVASGPIATANANAIADVMRLAALAEAAQCLACIPFVSRPESVALTTRLTDALDVEADLIADRALRRALVALRLAVVKDAQARSVHLPDVVSMRLPGNVPAIVLAHRLYGAIGPAADLKARNRLRNPLFVPAALPIEVLTRGGVTA